MRSKHRGNRAVLLSVDAQGHTGAPEIRTTADDIARLDPTKCNIFTLWEKPSSLSEQPLFQRLVIEAWRRHSHDLCNDPFLITDDNVRQVIPDIPEEYFKLPYPAAKSDFIRYAVLYHNGGIYVDFDMLAVKDIDEIVEKIQRLDLVSYSDGYGPEHESCRGFSSNFLGGFDDKKEQCHIPWGGLGEWISHNVFASRPPASAFCFSGNESFNPDRFEFVLEHKQKLEDANAEFEASHVPQPLSRRLYHFFNALHGWERHTCAALFNETTLVGHLFSTSFSSGHGAVTKANASSEFLRAHPEFNSVSKNYVSLDGRSLPCQVNQ